MDGRAMATVVRRLEVPRGFEVVQPHGLHIKEEPERGSGGERLGRDYKEMLSKVEKELCVVEGLVGNEAAAKSGRKEGAASLVPMMHN